MVSMVATRIPKKQNSEISSDTPEFLKGGFKCPHCSVWAHQEWGSWSNGDSYLDQSYVATNRLWGSKCQYCKKYCYWHNGELIFPAASTAPIPADDMPEDCKELYKETRDIADKSARGAGALIRLCLEKLLIELGGRESNNINSNIALLLAEGKITERVQKAADLCRLNGNAFVHPSAINLEDSDKDKNVLHLFKLINLIVENAITEPKQLEADFGSLPDAKKEEIAKRNERAMERLS